MANANPLHTRTAASPSSAPPSLTQVPSRAAPAPSAYITSVGLHPVEPFLVIGLSSGELCLYTAGTDALSWILEMDAARQAQLRHTPATVTGDEGNAKAGGGRHSAVRVAPPASALKVLSFAALSSAAAAAGGCAILHCGFLRGREEDLRQEVLQRALPAASSSGGSVARHLVYVVTNANDVFVADIKSEALLVRWSGAAAASGVVPTTARAMNSSSAVRTPAEVEATRGGKAISSSSPLHAQFVVTQAETYGALLFLTVARRSAVQRVWAASLSASSMGGGGPERNATDRCNEPVVYMLHWGYSNPFAAASAKGLAVGGGAYVVKAAPQDKGKVREPAAVAATTTTAAPPSVRSGSDGRVTSLSIRAHPFAPLLMLIVNRAEVQVFAVDGNAGELTSKTAQLVLFSSLHSSTSSSREVVAAARTAAALSSSLSSSSLLIDAQFVPSAAVLTHSARHADPSSSSPSSSSSSGKGWSCQNVQLLLLSPSRLRLICTRGASPGESARTVAVDRAFYTTPDTNVAFQRAWTWLGSPDTFFVLQSDRTVVELSCNDLLAASTEVPVVRSVRTLTPRTARSDGASAASPSPSPLSCDWWCLPPVVGGGGGLPCVQLPDVLPLWGRGATLSGVFAPRLPAAHSDDPQTVVFSRLTGMARPLPIADTTQGDDEGDEGSGAAASATQPASTLHLSLLADTETVSSRCIVVRLCLAPQRAVIETSGGGGGSGASPTASTVPATRGTQESVNISIARVLADTAAPALCRLEHGFYYVGSREESAYADHPFLVAGLLYMDGVAPDPTYAGGAISGGGGMLAGAQLRVAMVCLPADRGELRQLYETAKAECGGSADGAGAFAPPLQPSAALKQTLRRTVQHAQVQALPIPQFDFESPQSGLLSKQLLSCAFQLSNDGVVPCVWGLWAPVYPHTRHAAASSSSSPSRTRVVALPAPQPLQLTMQSFYVAAESHQLLWRPPELVQMNDLLASNPSQVFALNSVLTTGGRDGAAAAAAAPLPAPYATLDDVLRDVEAAVVARLFLYYADRKVLVLATVETGSSREAGFDSEVIDDTYNFASRARNGRVVGNGLFAAVGPGQRASTARGDGRQYLRLVPHAAAEMNDWKAEHAAEALSCSLLTAVQLSAIVVSDHGEPALQVAVTSRRFGVALAMFPLAGRRGTARVSAALQPVKVHLYRRWSELLCVTAAVTQQAEASGRGGRVAAAFGEEAEEDVRHSPLLRRYRAWMDTIAAPSTTYASVPLVQWVWPPAWPTHRDSPARAAATPILLLQRGRALYVLHTTGAAVQVCTSLMHCSPLQVVSLPASELCLQHGSYPGLLARTRLLRQLQLQYSPYQMYADATLSSQAPAVKVSWFKKFWKRANSSGAARMRAKERPHQMAWLQSVYAPTAEALAYHYASSATSSAGGASATPQISAALERLAGAGVTHVGNVLDVGMTDSVRLATLAVEALAASRGMQQLVSSAGILDDALRQTLRHLMTVLDDGAFAAQEEKKEEEVRNGEDGTAGAAAARATATPMSIMRGNWAVAEALARLPLSCVVAVMAHEVRRAAAAATAASAASAAHRSAGNSVSDAKERSRRADLRRWWWLLMRCSALVTAVNAVQIEAVSDVMTRLLDDVPISSPLLQPPADEEAVTESVAQALLLCSPRFQPHAVSTMLASGTTSETQQVRRLEAAVRAALRVLGAQEVATAAQEDDEEDEERQHAGDVASGPAKTKKKPTSNGAAATPWSSLFSTVTMDGAHWTNAVYFTNLMQHLRHLATSPSHTSNSEGEAEAASTATSAMGEDEPVGVHGQVRTVAAQCVAGADAAVEASATAVLDVATQTVGVLLGAVVDVPAASRSRMADAVAQSTSRRQQVLLLQTSDPSAAVARRQDTAAFTEGGSAPSPTTRALTANGAAGAETDMPAAQEDVYMLDETPVDRLRHALYAAQWRDLYGTFAYPTCYCFRPAARSGKRAASAPTQREAGTGSLPFQLAYNAVATEARAREAAASPAVAPAAAASPSAHHSRDRRQVQKVVLTEQRPPTPPAAPAVELEAIPTTPLAAAAAAPQSGSPLSLRAAVAKEEAELHQTYFTAFAAQEGADDDDEGNATASRTAAAAAAAPAVAMGGNEAGNDSILRKFRAQLSAVDGAEEGSASTVRRERQQAAERQRVPAPSSFAPSVTRRAAAGGGGGADNYETSATAAAAAHENVYGDNLYGAVPSQQAFFARFQATEDN